MVFFNSTDTHAALSFVTSGHVVIFDAQNAGRWRVFALKLARVERGRRMAAWHTRDDRYLIVANQNGKKLERIRTDYANNLYAQEPAATLDLAGCTTPNGVPCEAVTLRPDNAPICGIVASDNGPSFVSLRGGGMFVVDWRSTPMKIVKRIQCAECARQRLRLRRGARLDFRPNGGGGTRPIWTSSRCIACR